MIGIEAVKLPGSGSDEHYNGVLARHQTSTLRHPPCLRVLAMVLTVAPGSHGIVHNGDVRVVVQAFGELVDVM